MSEKTEKPTPHKLKQARDEGQVAKSEDVAIAASMAAVVGVLLALGQTTADRLRAVLTLALSLGEGHLSLDVLFKRMGAMALEGLLAIAPYVLVAAFGAAAGRVAQIGFRVTTKAVQLKLDAINPAEGFKKVFSLKALLTFLQMVLKAVVITAVLWQLILQLLPLISAAVFQSPSEIAAIAWGSMTKILVYGVGLFIVVAPIDFAIQRHHFMKGQRMSKDDIKREYKSQEGDPEVKGQRKELARELANEAPARKVAGADAVIVNPTHYAVAIRYRADEVGVPVVLAKGVDEAAVRLRLQAEEHGVPIFSHPPLARALYLVEIDHPVPADLFEPVAVVLKWVDDVGARRDLH